MRNLNLDQLETFVTAADLGSLAAAARALHLSPPAVSLHVSELEARTGLTLLRRGSGRATLTPEGEVLAARGRQLLATCDEMVEQARARGRGSPGTLRLASTAGVEPQLLPKLLHALEARCPGIDVRLDALGSREALDRLRRGSLDLALVALPLEHGAEVELVPWRTDPVVALLPAGWKVPARITPAWLAQHTWIGFGPPTQLHAQVAGWFVGSGVRARPRFELNQLDALLALVTAGHGAALLPWPAGSKVPAGSGVQVRPLAPALPRALAVACRRGGREALVDSALAVLAALARARSGVIGGGR